MVTRGTAIFVKKVSLTDPRDAPLVRLGHLSDIVRRVFEGGAGEGDVSDREKRRTP